jgi:hypothetical protein
MFIPGKRKYSFLRACLKLKNPTFRLSAIEKQVYQHSVMKISLPSPGFIVRAFVEVVQRFPSVMLCAFVGVACLFVLIEDNQNTEFLGKTLMVCILGIPLLTGLVAFAESKEWSKQKNLLLQLAGLAGLAAYWFVVNPEERGFEYRELPGYVALLLVSHLFVSVAPYLNQRSIRDFWEYNKELFANIIIGAAFSFILFAGISLAILAIDQLFDLNFSHAERVYLRLFFVMAGIFNTTYFLFHFPKQYEFPESETNYNVIFKNLCKFILIPIVLLYFVILYAYAFKILGTWSLPRGWVGSLVTGFSVAGILTYLLNFYLPNQDESMLVVAYKRWFWWILLPLTLLLFVAIGKRIGDYGVTEERFLVAQMGVWLLLNCIYFLLSKKDNIKFIPISLALFALTWAFGPFSAKAVAERSQLGRIERILSETGRMENGKMKIGSLAASDTQIKDFESAVEFLERRERLAAIQDLMPIPLENLPEAPGYYGVSGKLRAWLAMGATTRESEDAKEVRVYGYIAENQIDIRGFSNFKQINLDRSSQQVPEIKGEYFVLSSDGKYLNRMNYDGQKHNLVEQYDLQPLAKKWMSKRGASDQYYDLGANERVTDILGKKGSVRLAIENGNAIEEKGNPAISSLSGFLFSK